MEDRNPAGSPGRPLDEILSTLGVYRIRATYGAVAEVLGCKPQSVGAALGKRRKEASWIVNAKTGLPTGYATAVMHPQLTTNDHIVCGSIELEYLIRAWRSSDSRSKIPFTSNTSSRTAATGETVRTDHSAYEVPHVLEQISDGRSVCGIDWSGARDAGIRAWVAQGQISSGRLRLDHLIPGEQLPGSSSDIERFIPALVDWIKGCGNFVIGVDCPFGLPKDLVIEDSWEAFIRDFPKKHPNPDDFQQWCNTTAGGKELKRVTDRTAKTPFSPYNLRMYRQTYWGLRGLLYPLVVGDHVRVLPMQVPVAGKPVIVEVCPASTLKHLEIDTPYKGGGSRQRQSREQIIKRLVSSGLLEIRRTDREVVIRNQGGDALDAILAAISIARLVGENLENLGALQSEDLIEGRVYY
ncbi:MAG: hypothetical protein NPIRA05_22790 [Nitrospirales bacterium]|nr:MAG: hypothetical protein NPIRA05_22790 [Nitrospirales bacterium]